jgi:uncharacterized protein involved in exopolysaccharide biosynthesis
LSARRFRFAKIIGGFVLLALLLALFLPKKYTSSVLMRTKQPQSNGLLQQNLAVMALVGANVQDSTQAYMEMLKSRSVLNPVIDALDLPEETKKQLDNIEFAKKYLEIQALKGTNLIELSLTDESPEKAQKNAEHVVKSLRDTLTRLNRTEQSDMLVFLKERIALAEDELNRANESLEKFKQRTKVFLPEEQAKASIEKLTELDRQEAQTRVSINVNESKLREARSQLAKQNAALLKYSFTGNEAMQSLYDKFTEKRIALAELRQRYTDRHPLVVLAEKEAGELDEYLKNEIGAAIASESVALNPLHSELLQTKIFAEMARAVDAIALAGLRKIIGEEEAKIGNLSENGLVYLDLFRKTKVAEEVYGLLVKNYEEARLREAMESMSIEVIDEANLPLRHSWPKRTLIVALGLLLGIVASFAHLGWLYFKEEREMG